MSFTEWITSSYPNPSISGQWGLLHILTLVLCVAIIVTLALVFRNKSEKVRRRVLWVLTGLLLLFEITRRIINFVKADGLTFQSVLSILLARPMCAMMVWTLIISAIVNKTRLYNFASFGALLSAIIFFAYPGVGFNNQFILFENLYSIVSHSLLLITSISLITLRFTKFKYNTMWQSLIYYVVCVGWAFFEAYVLGIEHDAMYFMPSNDIMEIVGLSYGVFLTLYIVFMVFYINLFYVIDDRKTVKELFNKKR